MDPEGRKTTDGLIAGRNGTVTVLDSATANCGSENKETIVQIKTAA